MSLPINRILYLQIIKNKFIFNRIGILLLSEKIIDEGKHYVLISIYIFECINNVKYTFYIYFHISVLYFYVILIKNVHSNSNIN